MTFLAEFDAAAPADRVDLVHRWIGESPKEFFAELRRSRPILSTPGPVVVTRFADVREVLSRETDFSVRLYAPKIDACVGPFMLSRDATTFNTRDKAVMQSLLRPEDLPRVAETSRRLAEAAVSGAGGHMEVVSALTRRVPVDFCGEYFGFPGPDATTMLRWSRAANHDMFGNLADDPDVHRASVEVGLEMQGYVDELIARRRADPGDHDDILGRLLAMDSPDSLGFDSERIRANTMFLLIGGVETTSATAVQILTELFRRPRELAAAQAAARAADGSLLSAYLWEALRLNPTFQFLVRYTEQDSTIAAGSDRAAVIPAGTTVYAAIGSAMFDELEVEDPEEFRLDRPDPHLDLHFGYGHHRCLCYHLSRVQIPAMLGPLLRCDGLRPAEGPEGQVDMAGGPFPEKLVLDYDLPGLGVSG